MKKHVKLLLMLLLLGANLTASSQGFLKKLDNIKNKMNTLDNKYREDWIPFPKENYRIKAISCAYGSTPVYQLKYSYDDNGLLQGIDVYGVSQKTGRLFFHKTLYTFSYSNKEKVVIRKNHIYLSKKDIIYSYSAYKMDKGKIVAKAFSETPFTFPIPFAERFSYNDAGKLNNTRESTYTYNDKGQLTSKNTYTNGLSSTFSYEYDAKNPMLLSSKREDKRKDEETFRLASDSFRIVSNGSDTEEVREYPEGGKVLLTVKRDPLDRIISVTDNMQDRQLKATIEYEDRVSNEKLFTFGSDPLNFFQFGNIASQYKVPFVLIYFDED